MMVLHTQTEEGEDIPNAAIKQPCHASFLRVASSKQACAPFFRIRPAHVQTLGGMGGHDLAYTITGSRCKDKDTASQPARSSVHGRTAPQNGDDMTMCRGETRAYFFGM